MTRRSRWLLVAPFLAACAGTSAMSGPSGAPTTSTTSTSTSATAAAAMSAADVDAAPVPLPTTAPRLTTSTLPPPPAAVRAFVPDGWAVPLLATPFVGGAPLPRTTFVATSADDRIDVVVTYPVAGARAEGADGTAGDDHIGPYAGRLRYGTVGGLGTDRFDWGIAEVQVPSCGVVGVASLGLDEPTLRAVAATAGCQAGAGIDVTPPAGFRRVPAPLSADARELDVQMVDHEDPTRIATVSLLRAGYLDVAALAGPRAVGAPITLGGQRAWWQLFDPPPTDPTTVSDWQATIDVGPGRAVLLFARAMTRPEVDTLVARVAAGFDGALPPPTVTDAHVVVDPPADGGTVTVRTAGDGSLLQWSGTEGGVVWAMEVARPTYTGPSTGPVLAEANVLGTTVPIDTSRGAWTATVALPGDRWLWLAASGVTPAQTRAVLGGLHTADDATWARFVADHPPVALRP